MIDICKIGRCSILGMKISMKSTYNSHEMAIMCIPAIYELKVFHKPYLV